HAEPAPISSLQPLTPRLLDQIVKKCLAKEPDDRWQSARDLASQLRWAEGSAAYQTAQPLRVQRLWRRAIPVIVAAAAAALVTFAALSVKPVAVPSVVTRFTFALGEEERFIQTGRRIVAMSPDGTRMVYQASSRDGARLYLRTMADSESKVIRGTE